MRSALRSIFASDVLTTTMGFSQAIAVQVEEEIFLGRNGNWHTYGSDSIVCWADALKNELRWFVGRVVLLGWTPEWNKLGWRETLLSGVKL
jgi:hypothetical protein